MSPASNPAINRDATDGQRKNNPGGSVVSSKLMNKGGAAANAR